MTPGGFLFSYAVSGVLVGIAILISSLVYTSSHVEVARQESRQPARVVAPESTPETTPDPVWIGWITGVADCHWVDDHDAPAHNRVALGAKYMLASGLMEITYKTGAKVILQGPCTYEAESAAGGFLSLGKLTARLESRSRLPDGTSRSRLPSGTLPTDRDTTKSHPAGGTYFAVRTPTATVTDLGTEFGVEVNKEGTAQVVVFVGEVVSTLKENGDTALEPVRLTAGQSATLGKKEIIRIPNDGTRKGNAGFVRKVVPRRPLPLVGFYPLANDARDHSGRGNHVKPSKMHGVEFVAGPAGRAARFREDADSYIDLPIDASPVLMPRMTWGALVRPLKIGPIQREILSTDNLDNQGYDRVLTIDDRKGDQGGGSHSGMHRFGAFCGYITPSGILYSQGPRPEEGRRVFVAAVYDQMRQTADIYVEDGEMNGGRGGLVWTNASLVQIGSSHNFVRVGRHTKPCNDNEEPFDGEIDNIFLFSAALASTQLEAIRAGGAKAILAIAKGDILEKEDGEKIRNP